jgi:hypothetical protein
MRAELVVFRELASGDLRKFKAASNNAASGGGARDLRFRPYDSFQGAFERLFPVEASENRRRGKRGTIVKVRRGKLHWADPVTGATHTQEAQFEPPTDARGNEGRLVKVHEYACFQPPYPKGEGKLVLVLARDSDGAVWAHITSENSLRTDKWHPMVASAILDCLDAKRSRRAIPQGYIHLSSGDRFCND